MQAQHALSIVMAHGAWCDSKIWRKVVPLLEEQGHRVAAPDLPGCGANRRPYSQIALETYVETLVEAASGLPGRLLLVGHSLGGIFVSQAGERMADRVAGLLYVSAFMLRDGESQSSAYRRDPAAGALALNRFQEPGTGEPLLTFAPEAFRKIFARDCTDEEAQWMISRVPPLPEKTLEAPLRLSESAYGRLPRFYVRCLQDRAISPEFQRWMMESSPVRKAWDLDSGHMPSLTHPRQLAELILEVAREAAAA
jgi:pimeloyl-ACP methyl ester carboxylesterase